MARYLKTAVRSTNDVRNYLTRRRVAPRTREAIVLRAEAQGLLDDEAAVRLWADHWARRGYAWALIEEKLASKGFEEAAIRAAATTYGHASDDEQRARAAVSKALRCSPSLPSRQAHRLARMLASRGFDPDLIGRVVGETLGSE